MPWIDRRRSSTGARCRVSGVRGDVLGVTGSGSTSAMDDWARAQTLHDHLRGCTDRTPRRGWTSGSEQGFVTEATLVQCHSLPRVHRCRSVSPPRSLSVFSARPRPHSGRTSARRSSGGKWAPPASGPPGPPGPGGPLYRHRVRAWPAFVSVGAGAYLPSTCRLLGAVQGPRPWWRVDQMRPGLLGFRPSASLLPTSVPWTPSRDSAGKHPGHRGF